MLGSDMTANNNTPCRLYNEFMSGILLMDYDYAILATNMIYFNGGQNLYYQGLDNSNGLKKIGSKRAYFNYVLENNYMPTSCQKCKYENQCNHGKNIIDTMNGNVQLNRGQSND